MIVIRMFGTMHDSIYSRLGFGARASIDASRVYMDHNMCGSAIFLVSLRSRFRQCERTGGMLGRTGVMNCLLYTSDAADE